MHRIVALAAIGFSLCAAQVVDPAKGLVLANSHVRFEFEPGGMGLHGMTDLATGFNHLQPGPGKHPLWEITLGRGAQTRILDSNYKPCNYAALEETAGGQRAVMEWNDVRFHLEDRVITVRITIDLPGDSGIAAWRILVENQSDYWGLWSVAFPVASGFPDSAKYDIARPVFASGGNLLKAWSERVHGRHPSGGWPMQFCSLTRGDQLRLFRLPGRRRPCEGFRHRAGLPSCHGSLSGEHGRGGFGLAGLLPRAVWRLSG